MCTRQRTAILNRLKGHVMQTGSEMLVVRTLDGFPLYGGMVYDSIGRPIDWCSSCHIAGVLNLR